MDTREKLMLAAIVVAALAIVVREWRAAVLERKRSQPIVITHEFRAPRFDKVSGWVADTYLTNEGGGAAFNVRFGLELRGVRYPFRLEPGDPLAGNRQRVVRNGARLPEDRTLPLWLSSMEMWGAASRKLDGKLHASRVYWCRFENGSGQTWETLNPWDRSAGLKIKRVWLPRVREWRETRRRTRADADWEKAAQRMLHELHEAMPREVREEVRP